MSNAYKMLITTSLNSIGYMVGLGSIGISLLNNQHLSILLPIYIGLMSYSYELIEASLGKHALKYISILDPTNAMSIVLVRPHIKDAIDILNYISCNDEVSDKSVITGLMYDRNAGALTSAGTIKDLMEIYKNFNITKYFSLSETSNEKDSYSLNSGTSAFLKYSIIFACRQSIPSEVFVGRNDLCAGIGEGGILAVNLLLQDKYSLDSIITRSAFEFIAYDSADRARSFTMDKIGSIESPSNTDIFMSELAYGITMSSYRIARPYVEKYLKEDIMHIAQEESTNYFNNVLYDFLDLNYDDIFNTEYYCY